MEKECRNCRYYGEYICMVPMYVDGKLYRGKLVKEDESCELFEKGEGEER